MIIIHGENTRESRKKLDEVLMEKSNIQRFDGKAFKADAIPLLFESTELFADAKIIVIENCKGLSKQSVELLQSHKLAKETDLIFWQDGNYDARLIKKFPHASVFVFPLPKFFFSFMDNLIPGKGKYLHSLYTQLLETSAPEQIFFSMVKRVRLLLVIKNGLTNEYEEVAKMSPWQKNKLQTQTRSWTIPQLRNFYSNLYKTEVAIKTSNLPIDLTIHIDNLILTELQ